MSDDTLSISCGDCYAPIPQPRWYQSKRRKPCKICGSTKRAYGKGLDAKVPIYSKLTFKARHPGRRPFAEGFVGDSLHRLTGVWSRVERIFWRDDDWYREHISDRKSGRVIRHVEHRLSEHKGHGADRDPRTPNT